MKNLLLVLIGLSTNAYSQMLTEGSDILYQYYPTWKRDKLERLYSLEALRSKNAPSFKIDTEKQVVYFSQSYDLEPTKQFTVHYDQIRSLGPIGFFPNKLTSDMVFNSEFVLKVLRLVKSNYDFQGAYIEGEILAHVVRKDGKVFLNTYQLRYFQHRSGYYSIQSKTGIQEYISYFGDHEIGKPTRTEALLGNESEIQSTKLEYAYYPYSGGVRSTDDLVLLVQINDQLRAFSINNLVNKISDQRQLNFIKENSHLVKYDERNKLFNWRYLYDRFDASAHGGDYLKCSNYKCFKEIYLKTNYNYDDSIRDLFRSVKYREDKKVSFRKFKKEYVPLFLKVSKVESSFYKKLATSPYIVLQVGNNMNSIEMQSSDKQTLFSFEYSGIDNNGISTVVRSLK
ncbi:MAG: hypothetical protein KA715_12970 [Xanthomonadaceae bacterium]|nr:hypothetical protein [Xanthomonadaceae bacterium]